MGNSLNEKKRKEFHDSINIKCEIKGWEIRNKIKFIGEFGFSEILRCDFLLMEQDCSEYSFRELMIDILSSCEIDIFFDSFKTQDEIRVDYCIDFYRDVNRCIVHAEIPICGKLYDVNASFEK